jgi:hypothetical protein
VSNAVLFESECGAPTQIDREAGIIRGVKLCGFESKNGRTYPSDVLEKARPLYEGRVVNANHDRKNGERNVGDRLGRFVNVGLRNGQGLYGDFEVLTSHPLAESVFEAAQRMPSLFGFSHNIEGRIKVAGGKQVVEQIAKVHSIDLVADPATVKSMFESEDTGPFRTLREVVESLEQTAPAEWSTLLIREMMTQGVGGPELPIGSGMGTNADNEAKNAFRAMVMAAFDDDTLDSKATLKKIKLILDAQEKIMSKPENNPNPTPAAGTPPVDEKAKESATPAAPAADLTALQEENRRLKAEKEARTLLAAAQIEPNEKLVESLAMLPDEAARKSLIEAMPKAPGHKPRSQAPAGGTQNVKESKIPDLTDRDALNNFIRSAR